VVQFLTQVGTGLVLAFIYCWRIALMCMGAVPLTAVAYLIGNHLVERLWRGFNEKQVANAAQAQEVLSQFRTVKAFDGETGESLRYAGGLEQVREVERKASWVHGVKDAFIMLFVWGGVAVAQYATMFYLVRRPEVGLTPGDLVVLLMSVMLAVQGVSQALGQAGDFSKAQVSAAKVLALIEKKPAVSRSDGDWGLGDGQHVMGRIELRDVGFRYPSREAWAVRHLSLVVEAGKTVAIVGESGSGKTTALQLLLRFYEIAEGEILIDGVDIRTLAPAFLRSKIAYVPQNPVLFSMSVGDNIRYTCPDATDADVAGAASLGNAHDFIAALPDQYGTEVQQTTLSGGQKQRVVLSRAILQNAPILLLDEATAALDTESEHLVQQSLETVRRGKTAIAVAHRLATVMNADWIFVMQDGQVVEAGTHGDLLARGAVYAELVKHQLL
jgi:ABC-type multidrug transport system fused ATPase/permease subunit